MVFNPCLKSESNPEAAVHVLKHFLICLAGQTPTSVFLSDLASIPLLWISRLFHPASSRFLQISGPKNWRKINEEGPMNIRMGCNDTCFCGTFGAGHGPPQLFTSHQGSLDNGGKGSMKMLMFVGFYGRGRHWWWWCRGLQDSRQLYFQHLIPCKWCTVAQNIHSNDPLQKFSWYKYIWLSFWTSLHLDDCCVL